MDKEKERELSPTALNPLVGIESLNDKNENEELDEKILEE